MAKIDDIDRKEDLAFILFHHTDEIEGITRLQKLLFLIEKETDITEYHEEVSFEFEPYHYGPFSEGVYDTLHFLLSIGAVELVEADEGVDSIREGEDQNEYAGRKFKVTEKGEKIARKVNDALEEGTENQIVEIMSEYSDMELDDLLEYVYREYEEYTTESKIRGEVLED